MYIYRLFNTKDWTLNFDCTPYSTYPKQHYTVKAWGNKNKADLTMNLCYFNFDTAQTRKLNAAYRTLEFLRIAKLGGDVAYGGTNERLTLPNGDMVAGHSLGIKDGVVKEKDQSSKRTRNGYGVLKDGTIFNVQTTSSVTLYSFCTTVNDKYKPKLFLCMDGGGSTSCYSTKSGIYFCPEGQREVASVFQATYKGAKVTRTLKQGCKGDDVLLLQMMLGNVECDGVFGSGTKSAVIRAQQFIFPKTKSEWDGVAGQKTLKALGIWKG